MEVKNTLTKFQIQMLKKIVDSRKPLSAYGLQVRTCKCLASMGLIVDSGGGWCPTHEGRVLAAKPERMEVSAENETQ